MTDAPGDVMRWLRDSTREQHDLAEHHEFQQSLVRGELSLAGYAAWLGQMYLVHQALEKALRKAASSEPIRRVVRDYQFQVPYLLADLEHLGIDLRAIEPLPATASFSEVVERGQHDPLWLLGLHYVLEGSNNGSRYIARRVSQAYGLEPGPGLRYLDPYGERQRERWLAFKRDMSAVGFSEAEGARLVEAAKQMYRSVAELGDDLMSRTGPPARGLVPPL